MAFDCVCGHTRGKHDHPEPSWDGAGKCNAEIVQGNKCACRKYQRKDNGLKHLRDYQKIGFSYMIIAWGCSLGLSAWISNLEEAIGYEPIHIGAMISGLLVLLAWYFKFGQQFFARQKAECLE